MFNLHLISGSIEIIGSKPNAVLIHRSQSQRKGKTTREKESGEDITVGAKQSNLRGRLPNSLLFRPDFDSDLLRDLELGGFCWPALVWLLGVFDQGLLTGRLGWLVLHQNWWVLIF